MSDELVSIQVVVHNGEYYIRECLRHIFLQTYPNIEVFVFDNNSTDSTREIVKKEFPQVKLIENDKNYGMGGGQNRCFEISKGDYVIFHSVDVLLDKDYVKKGVRVFGKDLQVGVVQAKILQYNKADFRKTNIIDTTGMEIYRSRRIINRGHGEEDVGQYDKQEEVFSYEGASGFFRRTALEDSKINGEILDEDFWWYADDIDLGWRMHLLGWKQVYVLTVLAWHDRQTTKRLRESVFDFIKLRKEVPARKRALDYHNIHLTIIKNDFLGNIVRDFSPFTKRELALFIYTLIFEPRTVLGWFSFFVRLPKILKKRRIIMSQRKVSSKEMRKWFKNS